MVGGGGGVRGRRRRHFTQTVKTKYIIQNKGARDMLNKHVILLTENFGRTLEY